MALTLGTRLGVYEIIAQIGEGGMGQVFRARDTRLDRDVAIKILPEAFAHDADRLARFTHEAKTLASLNHPNIAGIYGLEESGGVSALVMELVEGDDLSQRIAKGAIPIDEALPIAKQIAEALEAAHAKGIVHRDIKPGNIMVTGRRHVKVLDFGLARHVAADHIDETRMVTAAGTIVGTPHYMSPEVLQGKPADARSDIWALGVVLYELTAGALPFQGPTAPAVSSAILRDAAGPLPADVPSRLRAVVARCLEKRPEDRYQDAGEVRAALEDLQTKTAPASPARTWAAWVAAAVAVAALAAAAWIFVRPGAASADRRTSSGAPASANQEANDAFELAMQFARVQNDLARSTEMLERAIALDPHFAEARRSHAFNYILTLLNGFSNDTNSLYKAEEELRQASREDPTLESLPATFTALYLMLGRRELVPIDDLDRVVQKNPMNREAVLWRAILYWQVEDNTAVTKLITNILERDPLFAAARMFLGETMRTSGDTTGAIREQQKVLAQAPGNISAVRNLTVAYMDAGDLEKAHSLLESKRSALGRNYGWRATHALLLAREGNRSEAIEAMDEDTLKYLSASLSTLDAAEFYALLGDTSKAIEWLDRAVRNGDERIDWFRRDPRLIALRDMATGRARGFAFVEMSSDDEAQKAIAELNEYQLGGRSLSVNEARPKPAYAGGFGGGELRRRSEPRW